MGNTAKKIEIPRYDAKQEILNRLGNLDGFEIAQNQVLVAIYQRGEFTPGGIIQVAKTLKEDVYQGKIGLVVKIGPGCQFEYTSKETGIKYGIPIELHDWIVTRPSDTWPLDINMRPETLARDDFWPCRMVFPEHIRAKIVQPDMVW